MELKRQTQANKVYSAHSDSLKGLVRLTACGIQTSVLYKIIPLFKFLQATNLLAYHMVLKQTCQPQKGDNLCGIKETWVFEKSFFTVTHVELEWSRKGEFSHVFLSPNPDYFERGISGVSPSLELADNIWPNVNETVALGGGVLQ